MTGAAADTAAAAGGKDQHKTWIDRMPGPLRFALCSGGIYVCYICYGIVQEWVYSHRSSDGTKFNHTLTLLFVQYVINTLLSFANFDGDMPKKFPKWEFLLPAGTFLMAMLFSNEALKYVSYPTQVLGKSCKLVPVLLGNVLIFRKKQSLYAYLEVILVTVGIFIFQYKGGKSSEGDSPYGLMLLCGSLLMDAITGPAQERIRDKYKPSSQQFGFYMNGYAVLIVAVLLAVSGEGLEGFQYMLDPENYNVLIYILLFSLCGAFGQTFIFLTMRYFGALTLTTVTTTRKFFTILASVVIFGHVLSMQQWMGVLVVFAGLACEALAKYAKQANAKKIH